MATETLPAKTEIVGQVQDLIKANHPDLLDVADEICVLMSWNTSAPKEGEEAKAPKLNLGTAGIFPEKFRILTPKPYKFLIHLSAETWEDRLDSAQREALLDHHLESLQAEFDADTGKHKLRKRKPDILAYKANIRRYGMWFPTDDDGDEDVARVVEGGVNP